MTMPVLFVLDRDRGSLPILLGDLRRRFGNDFTVTGESSPDGALKALDAMARADEPVALFLVDDRSAAQFLARAHELYPRTKRVLLVDRDYSSTSPAVQAIALGQADFHIVRPWANDEMMYGEMSDYLASWTREQEPSFEMFRIVAEDGDSRVVQLRDVMTRFSMPFGIYSVENDAGRRLLDEAGLDASRLPVVIRYDGQVSIDPNLTDLARAIGVSVENEIDNCDVAIIGAGPAGLTAAVYAASEGLETVLLEQAISGGQAGTSPLIRNYPGFPHGVNGGLLMEKTCEQAWLMGAHIVFAQEAIALEPRSEERVIRLVDGTKVSARAVVIATGVAWRRLGIATLEELVGHGVFYGAAVK
jgi:thioredoxin reductase (NADPH)